MTLFELAAVLTLNKSAFDKGISEAEGQAQGFGSKLKSGIAGGVKAAAGALTASTGAVVGFGKSAVEAGMTFDTSMSQVAATMGTTVDEIQDLRDFAQKMGSETAFSATQAADALNYMALAGYDADKSMEMLPNVLNLAAAGGIDLAYASDMVTDSQSALGLSMDETAELVDKMAKTSSKSNTSVSQLGEAILTVGGTAKTLAGGTTELSTALGILADNGVKGAEGGTALRNIILSLSAPTDTAAAAMESLGLEVFDAAGNMRPLNETFGDLNNALSTMTQGEQTQVLNEIFNKVDLKSVNALLANTGERFDELSGYIDEATGAAQSMADTQLDTLTGDITLFQSAMEGAKIQLSDGLTPAFREFVQFATNGIGDITNAFSEGGMEDGFAQIGTTLSEGIMMIAENAPQAVEAGALLLENLTYGIIENIPVIVNSISNVIPSIVEKLSSMLPKLASAGLEIVKSLAKGISENIQTITTTAAQVIADVAQTLTDPESLTSILEAGLSILTGLAQGILDAIPILIEALPEVINNIVTFILDSIPLIIDTGIQLLTSLVAALPDIISAIVNALPKIIDGIINGLLGAIPQIIDAGVKLLVSLIQNLPTIISEIVNAIPKIIDGIVNGVLGNLDKIIMAGVQLFVSLIQNLPTIIIEIVKAVPQIIGGIVDAFGSLMGSIVEIGGNLLKGIWDGICGAADWLWSQIEGFFGGIVDGICDFLGIHSPSRVFADIGKNMALGAGEGFDDEFAGIQKDINDQLDFSGSADLVVNNKRNYIETYSGAGEPGAGFTGAGASAAAAPQPLVVIVQLESGLEVARAFLEDINDARRLDGLPAL